MSRTIHRLTAREVTTATPPEGRQSILLSDGGNLLLQVAHSATGGYNKSWIFRYGRDGKRHDLGLGPLRDISLKDARERARALRVQLLDGIDPYTVQQQQRADRLAHLAERARAMTFKQCAEAYMRSHESGWSNPVHRRQWGTTLQTYCYPVLGDVAVDQVDTAIVMTAIEPLWRRAPETGSRVRGRIESILDWAKASGYRSGENPARWRGHLDHLLPARSKVQGVKRHAALPYGAVPALMADLAKNDHIAARGLEFTILTAARTGEAMGAAWDEFDFTAKTWTIPASRMKAKKEHRVPLSDRVLALLSALPRAENSARVFPLGEVAMHRLLKKLRPDVTVHGFRSSFRDWCAECTGFPREVAEMALAHAVGDKVEAAYRRGDLFEKRRRLMADWTTWCSRPVPTGAAVTALAR
jgi:integrase